MVIAFNIIWSLMILTVTAYVIRVLLLAHFVHRKMKGNLDVMGFISDVVMSTLSIDGIYGMVSGRITRKIKENGRR